MSKEIDLIKCIISEIDNNLYSDFGGNPCISYTSNLKKLLLALDTPEVRHFFENYNKQAERIAELEEQLKNCIRPKFEIGQEVFYVAPKRQIVKAIVIGCFENGLIVKCKNRNFIKLLNENIFSSEENAKISIEKYYKDIPKNYQRNKLNNVYWKMKERCYNPKSLSYINYGAVGITMCDEWKNSYNEFKTWAENNGYKEDIMPNGRNRLTLDRIDNSKGYCPSNCRWVTQKDQQNNRRNNRNTKLEELKGNNYE